MPPIPPKHEGSVKEQQNRANLEYGILVHNAPVGLQELQREAVGGKNQHENVKAIGRCKVGPAARPDEKAGGECQHDRTFVELDRMARDAIAEIMRPRKVGRRAEGEIVHASEETADPPDTQAQSQRQHENSTGRSALAADQLVKLDPHDGPQHRAEHAATNPRMPRDDQIKRPQPIGAECGRDHQHHPIGKGPPGILRQTRRHQIAPVEPPAGSTAERCRQEVGYKMQVEEQDSLGRVAEHIVPRILNRRDDLGTIGITADLHPSA